MPLGAELVDLPAGLPPGRGDERLIRGNLPLLV